MVVFWQKTQSRRLPSSKRTPVLRGAVNAVRAMSADGRFFSRRLKFPDLGADPQTSPIKSPAHKGAKVKGTSDSIQMRRFGTTDLAIVLGLWSAMAVVLGGVLSEVMSDSASASAERGLCSAACSKCERVSGRWRRRARPGVDGFESEDWRAWQRPVGP